MYKNWWIPVQEVIIIDKTKKKESLPQVKQKEENEEVNRNRYIIIQKRRKEKNTVYSLSSTELL